jgi:putative ABC transport system permease protein
MINKRFIYRQVASARKQAAVFVLCVALSMVTLVAISGFSDSVNRTLNQDARKLQAGDVILRSNAPFSESINTAVNQLTEQGQAQQARMYEFITVVRVTNEDNSQLANLKVVDPGYPFYGEVELESGRPLTEVLVPGQIVVQQALLDRLGLVVGDPLRVGETTLKIADISLGEPDRPVDFFSFGPRIFIAIADLESLDLVKEGSRVDYRILLKVANENDIDRVAAALSAVAENQETVETFRTAESGVKRFLDNFLFFLSLIGIFTLQLAGIGTQSSLTAFLKEKEATIAIVKTLGADRRFVTTNYMAVVAILGLLGTLLGLGAGIILQLFFPIIFAGLLPPGIELVISGRAIFESFLLGFFVVTAFTFLPLYQLNDLKPRFIFRKEVDRARRGLPYYITVLFIFLFFVGLVLWQLQNIRVGLYFVMGVIALIIVTTLITELVLFVLRRQKIKSLVVRQALKGLFRPRNATRAIIITLATALAVVFAMYLIEQNLDAVFVESYPNDAPNVFFVDIQADQVEGFVEVAGFKPEFYPVIRASIVAVNGEAVARRQEEQRRGDNLSRQFILSYRDDLLDGEAVSEGPGLFNPDLAGLQVSLLDEIRDVRDFQVGDIITFKIQGVPLEATVSSIRTSTSESFRPLFNFILPEAGLKNVPQSIFTAARVEPDEIPALQNRVVASFPNVTVINVAETIDLFAKVVGNLSQIIRFFTLFSILAGILIIISSVLATRFARIQEAVYFKVLGAKGRFVLAVFTLENLLLGLVSAILALFLSHIGSWAIVTWGFDLTYKPFVGASVLLVIFTVLLVITVGMLASLSILRQRPVNFLKEQTEE